MDGLFRELSVNGKAITYLATAEMAPLKWCRERRKEGPLPQPMRGIAGFMRLPLLRLLRVRRLYRLLRPRFARRPECAAVRYSERTGYEPGLKQCNRIYALVLIWITVG